VSARNWSIRELHATHPRIAIDANVLIYALEADPSHGPRARAVVDALEEHQVDVAMGTVGQIEILSGPAGRGDGVMFEHAANELRSMGLRLIPLSAVVAEDAAWIRAQGGLGLADAIHVASARAAGATAFVTNDRRIRSRAGLEVLYLDDLMLDDPPG
jgi:predicted nucleic acid-binding protein